MNKAPLRLTLIPHHRESRSLRRDLLCGLKGHVLVFIA